jgi:glycosyltransferase involved in cell wall biosynthesis
MALTVLGVAFPFAPVGGDAVGGAEQVLASLDAGLVRAGHRSLVVACEGSTVAGTLLPVRRVGGIVDDAIRAAVHAQVRAIIADALDRYPVDVIHMHGLDFAACLPPPGVPVLATLHLPLSWYPPQALAPTRPGTWLNGVSASQMAGAAHLARMLAPIENGVAVDRLAIRVPKHRFAVSLGRICPEQGFHLAIEAARSVDMQFVLAGAVFPYAEHQRHFREDIQPLLDGRRRFVGAVGFSRKRWILGAARCLLAPSLVAEASSLAAMEAAASGTPVVAFPNGALADIVEPGVTGFLVRDVAEMADAIADAGTLDPEACRAAARARFTVERMVERYLTLYANLTRGALPAAGAA